MLKLCPVCNYYPTSFDSMVRCSNPGCMLNRTKIPEKDWQNKRPKGLVASYKNEC